MGRITKIEANTDSANKKLRVAAYARVSTGSDDQLISLEAQKNHYERLIKSRSDWEFAGLYFDEGISGTKMAKRDGLLSMIVDCERGQIDYILVKSISRFSRNTVESIETVRKLYGMGVYIFFEKENIDTGKMEGELLLSILSSLAESESRSISENSTWSIQKRFRNGTFKIPYPPYGYDNVNGEMVVIPEQGEIVRRMYAQVLAGVSPSQIAKELNEQGVPTKRNGKWTAHTIIGIIRNEKYTGDVIFQKTYTDATFTRHVNRGEKDQFYAKDHHEALISREDYDIANQVLDRNGLEKGITADDPKYQNRYVFTKRIVCNECGGTWKRIKREDYFGFCCTTHLDNKDACSMKSIREDKVKAAFTTMMNKLTFGREKVLRPYLTGLENMEKAEFLDELNALEDGMEENLQKRQQIKILFSKGFIDPAVFAQENDSLVKEYTDMNTERNAIIRQISGGDERKESLKELMHYTAKGQMISDFDEELFLQFVDHIIVYSREEIGFAMKCGPIFRERID